MSNEPIPRHWSVTAACVSLLAMGLFNLVYSFTGIYAPYGIYYPAALALLTIIMFAAISGIWSMERWGVWVFLLVMLLKFLLDVWSKAPWEINLVFMIPGVVFLIHVRRMSV